MKLMVYIMVCAGIVLTSGCVRRSVTSRPGWKDPATGELLPITPNYEKTVENRIIWFWEPEYRETRKQFKEAEAAESLAE